MHFEKIGSSTFLKEVKFSRLQEFIKDTLTFFGWGCSGIAGTFGLYCFVVIGDASACWLKKYLFIAFIFFSMMAFFFIPFCIHNCTDKHKFVPFLVSQKNGTEVNEIQYEFYFMNVNSPFCCQLLALIQFLDTINGIWHTLKITPPISFSII